MSKQKEKTRTRHYAVYNDEKGEWERKPVKLRLLKSRQPSEPTSPLPVPDEGKAASATPGKVEPKA